MEYTINTLRNLHFIHFVSLVTCVTLLCVTSCQKKKSVPQQQSQYAAPDAAMNQKLERLRAVSLQIRDIPLSLDEAEKVVQLETNASQLKTQWLESLEHEARVLRLFNDWFGMNNNVFANVWDNYGRDKEPDGSWQTANGFPRCSEESQFIETEVWWEDVGNRTKLCNVPDCGPHALKCTPKTYFPFFANAIKSELTQRGLYAYKNNWTIDEFLKSNKIIANRFLYYVYLQSAGVFIDPAINWTQPYVADELFSSIMSLHLKDFSLIDAPNFRERAGFVTAPVFLQRYNNFRSRIRAMTNDFLCQDVSSTLNTSGIQSLVNTTSLTPVDRAHATRAECSGCHYFMDNAGSLLLGWNDIALWQFWQPWDMSGHLFGENGSGSAFFITQFLEQKRKEIGECLTRKTWHSISGGKSYSELAIEKKQQMQDKFKEGFKNFLQAMFLLEEI